MKVLISSELLVFLTIIAAGIVTGTYEQHNFKCNLKTMVSGTNIGNSRGGASIKVEKIENRLGCFNGVVVNGTCYSLPYRVGYLVSPEKASELCGFLGGSLVEIQLEKTYEALYNYIKRAWSLNLAPNHEDDTSVTIVLGSKYEGRKVVLQNGDEGFTRWLPGYPNDATGSSMYLRVTTKPWHTPEADIGMFNGGATRVSGIPLCKYPLKLFDVESYL